MRLRKFYLCPIIVSIASTFLFEPGCTGPCNFDNDAVASALLSGKTIIPKDMCYSEKDNKSIITISNTSKIEITQTLNIGNENDAKDKTIYPMIIKNVGASDLVLARNSDFNGSYGAIIYRNNFVLDGFSFDDSWIEDKALWIYPGTSVLLDSIKFSKGAAVDIGGDAYVIIKDGNFDNAQQIQMDPKSKPFVLLINPQPDCDKMGMSEWKMNIYEKKVICGNTSWPRFYTATIDMSQRSQMWLDIMLDICGDNTVFNETGCACKEGFKQDPKSTSLKCIQVPCSGDGYAIKDGQCGCYVDGYEVYNNTCIPKCVAPLVRQSDGTCGETCQDPNAEKVGGACVCKAGYARYKNDPAGRCVACDKYRCKIFNGECRPLDPATFTVNLKGECVPAVSGNACEDYDKNSEKDTDGICTCKTCFKWDAGNPDMASTYEPYCSAIPDCTTTPDCSLIPGTELDTATNTCVSVSGRPSGDCSCRLGAEPSSTTQIILPYLMAAAGIAGLAAWRKKKRLILRQAQDER